MNIQTINTCLSQGNIDQANLFPHLDRLKKASYRFEIDFGLRTLPTEPGILLIRGARQYGKSTWLEQEISKTIQQFGPGTAYYLNGDMIGTEHQLEDAIRLLIVSFAKSAAVKRLFIDEITAIPRWEFALKRLADSGELAEVLVITTGSKATDLRRGTEKLPGRKGRLSRSMYLFTPISYAEFHRVCSNALGIDTLNAYLISGGSPIACAELAAQKVLPEFVVDLTRDWIEGEIAASGRSRAALFNIMSSLFRFAGTPIGQAKLAREAELSNNTVAAGYIELLNDLGCVIPAYAWDIGKQLSILRKPCKYHFTNLLAAAVYHPARIRRIQDFMQLSEREQGVWYEWLIAQELLRRAAIQGKEILAPLNFWQSADHEIDFVVTPSHWLEVKRGRCSPLEFSWFARTCPHTQLTIVNATEFATQHIQGVKLENFLLDN